MEWRGSGKTLPAEAWQVHRSLLAQKNGLVSSSELQCKRLFTFERLCALVKNSGNEKKISGEKEPCCEFLFFFFESDRQKSSSSKKFP